MLISVVHQMCTYALYVGTIIRIWMVLSAGQRHWPWWKGAEKPGVGPQYAYVVHAFPFSAISEGNPCLAAFRSSKPPRRRRPDSKGQGTLCGQCRHGVRARIPRAFTCWWPPSSICWYSFSWSEITSCTLGLRASHPSDLNEWLPYSSQTACIRPVIAHVHSQGDAHQTIRGLP